MGAVALDDGPGKALAGGMGLIPSEKTPPARVNETAWFPSAKPWPICPARSRRSAKPRPRRCTTSPASIR